MDSPPSSWTFLPSAVTSVTAGLNNSGAPDHLINDAPLADPLALELPLGTEVPSVVIRCDGDHPGTGIGQKLGKERPDFGLTGL